MSCIGDILPYQIKNTILTWNSQQKIYQVGYAIDGLSSGSTTLDQAISASGLAIGDPYFGDANCLLTSFSVNSLDHKAFTACDLVASYVGFDFYGSNTQGSPISADTNLSYGGSASLNQDQTNANYTAPTTPLQVKYWENPANIGTNVNVLQTGCTIPVLKPYSNKIVRFYYIASGGFPDSGIENLESFVGFTNSDTWDSGVADSWLVTGVTYQSVGLPQQVMVECSFLYKPDLQYQWAFWKDPSGNSPPNTLKNIADPNQLLALTGSNGCRGILPYGEISFSSSFNFD